jgi:hypothetical protein
VNPSVPNSIDEKKQIPELPLRSLAVTLAQGSHGASQTAADLLSSLGARIDLKTSQPEIDLPSIFEAASSGLMHLTGMPEQAPLAPPAAITRQTKGALLALQTLCPDSQLHQLDAMGLLVERAAIFGLTRGGRASPGGSCRLLKTADQWIALNLAREEDLDLLPAWLGEGPVHDPWKFVEERIAKGSAEEIIARARLCGLPACVAAAPPEQATPWFIREASGPRRGREQTRIEKPTPLIIDLSALWAGPLCTHLLSLTGARVIKVESQHRPDGARWGPAEFYNLLNADKESVALDLRTPAGSAALSGLIRCADIVVESARPRALRQLGIRAEQFVQEQPGLTWVSITGYGRAEPMGNWVAFGDDASIAAGLALATVQDGDLPVFCGDAIADPLTGLHAALAALAFHRGGQSSLLDLSLKNVTAHTLFQENFAAEQRGDTGEGEVLKNRGRWEVRWGSQSAPVLPPSARKPHGQARELGADTEDVLEEFEISC